MKKIAIVTSNRAEYGLLKPLREELSRRNCANIYILVTGTHFVKDFGYTFQEIEKDQCLNVVKLPIEMMGTDNHSAVLTMSNVLTRFSTHFIDNSYDFLIVLGDRYETMAVCIAAMHHQIPIAHIHGGETTEGAIDEAIRHSVTKMSYLHFTSMETYRKRVIQLGENPERVFNVGALGVENILKTPLFSREELSENLRFDLTGDFGVVTYHPITLENISIESQMTELLEAINEFPHIKFIFTKANADAGGKKVNDILQSYVEGKENMLFIDSLGMQRYLSALKHGSFVLGNSSSGIIEAPSFGIPTINIGDRQKGRVQADSVINVEIKKADIVQGINRGLTGKRLNQWCNVINPYGAGTTSSKIADILIEYMTEKQVNLKKKFYDI